MIKYAAVLLCLASCNSGQVTPVVPEPQLPEEINVRDYGARGDGLTDDTAAFNAALGALGTVQRTLYVPAGVYIIRPTGGSPRGGLELLDRRNLVMRGAGLTATTLRMAPGSYAGDTHLILIQGSSEITISDLALDGNRSKASFRDEQNHCVETSRSSDIRFEKLRFHNCRGDGIRLIAPTESSAPWTERVTIIGSRFEDNGRSGVAVQRGVRYLHILDNTFDRISDQSIDIEPTGARAPTDLLIEGNLIRHTSTTWAVAIGGINSSEVARRLVFRNNRVENGSVTFGKADDVLIEGNTILGDPGHSALRLARNITNLRGIDNEITGAGGEGLVTVISYNGAYPSLVTLQGNTITASGGQSAVYVRDALHDVHVVGNKITGSGAATGINVANVAPLDKARSGFSIVDNIVINFGVGMRLSTSGDLFTAVTIRDNSIDNDRTSETKHIGILFHGTGPYQAFASIATNNYGPGIERQIVLTGN